MHPKHRLARALRWDLDRLDRAIRALGPLLRPAGLTVHVNSMGVTIRSADTLADDSARRLGGLRDSEEGIDNGHARLLHAALTRGLSPTASRIGDQPAIAYLHKQGVLDTVGDGSRLGLSRDAAYAFDVD